MKIRDLAVGSTITIDLLVKNAITKYTKPPGNKPYLWMELTDGSDVIQANGWDHGAATPPNKNDILTVVATVGEWAGNKQLTVKSYSVNTELTVAAFAPQGDFDLETYVQEARALIQEVQNPHVKGILTRVFNENAALWKTIPSAKGIHHAFVAGNLKHSVDVAIKARAIAKTMPRVNIDLCIAGGLLQDLGKLWTYELNGAVIDMTLRGQMIEHIMIGAIELEKYRTEENSRVVDLLQHIISSHHGQLEYGSPTTPLFLEAWIVCAADGLDAKTQVIYELDAKAKPGDIQLDKSYVLNNRQMLSISYVEEVMRYVD